MIVQLVALIAAPGTTERDAQEQLPRWRGDAAFRDRALRVPVVRLLRFVETPGSSSGMGVILALRGVIRISSFGCRARSVAADAAHSPARRRSGAPGENRGEAACSLLVLLAVEKLRCSRAGSARRRGMSRDDGMGGSRYGAPALSRCCCVVSTGGMGVVAWQLQPASAIGWVGVVGGVLGPHCRVQTHTEPTRRRRCWRWSGSDHPGRRGTGRGSRPRSGPSWPSVAARSAASPRRHPIEPAARPPADPALGEAATLSAESGWPGESGRRAGGRPGSARRRATSL